MAGEHEVVRPGRSRWKDVRVMAEQDAEIGASSARLSGRSRAPSGTRPDRLPRAARAGLVAPARPSRRAASGRREVLERLGAASGSRASPKSWFPSTAYVRGRAAEELAELRLAARVREQVAGQQHEVGLTLLDPRNRALDRPRAAGRHAEVEVGEVRDTHPVELGRQPGDSAVDVRSRTQPASNQPQPSSAAAAAPRPPTMRASIPRP